MKAEKKEEQITIRVDAEMYNDLKELAEAVDRPLANYIRLALKKIIEIEKPKVRGSK